MWFVDFFCEMVDCVVGYGLVCVFVMVVCLIGMDWLIFDCFVYMVIYVCGGEVVVRLFSEDELIVMFYDLSLCEVCFVFEYNFVGY